MGFGFEETMSGTWRDAQGAEHPIRFSGQVKAPSWRRFAINGVAELGGEVVAPPLTAGAALEGTIEIRPVIGRRITYDFTFTSDDGRRCRFSGQKDIRWRDALTTFTTLPAELRDEAGDLIGTCEMKFDFQKDWRRLFTSLRWQ